MKFLDLHTEDQQNLKAGPEDSDLINPPVLQKDREIDRDIL